MAKNFEQLKPAVNSCLPCVSGGCWPSLWASRDEVEAALASLCTEHDAEHQARLENWRAVEKSMAETMADPEKKGSLYGQDERTLRCQEG